MTGHKMLRWVPASEVVRGNVVSMADGAALTVAAVEHKGGKVTVTFDRGTLARSPSPATFRATKRVPLVQSFETGELVYGFAG